MRLTAAKSHVEQNRDYSYNKAPPVRSESYVEGVQSEKCHARTKSEENPKKLLILGTQDHD